MNSATCDEPRYLLNPGANCGRTVRCGREAEGLKPPPTLVFIGFTTYWGLPKFGRSETTFNPCGLR